MNGFPNTATAEVSDLLLDVTDSSRTAPQNCEEQRWVQVCPASMQDLKRIFPLLDLAESELSTGGRRGLTHAAVQGRLLIGLGMQGQILGCISYRPHPDGQTQLEALFIAEADRGRGIETALIASLAVQAAAIGHTGLSWILPSGEDWRTQMARSLGFRELAFPEGVPKYRIWVCCWGRADDRVLSTQAEDAFLRREETNNDA